MKPICPSAFLLGPLVARADSGASSMARGAAGAVNARERRKEIVFNRFEGRGHSVVG